MSITTNYNYEEFSPDFFNVISQEDALKSVKSNQADHLFSEGNKLLEVAKKISRIAMFFQGNALFTIVLMEGFHVQPNNIVSFIGFVSFWLSMIAGVVLPIIADILTMNGEAKIRQARELKGHFSL